MLLIGNRHQWVTLWCKTCEICKGLEPIRVHILMWEQVSKLGARYVWFLTPMFPDIWYNDMVTNNPPKFGSHHSIFIKSRGFETNICVGWG